MKRIVHDRKSETYSPKNPFSDRVRSLGISLRPCYLKISTVALLGGPLSLICYRVTTGDFDLDLIC